MSRRIVAKTAAWDAATGSWTFTFAEDVTLYAGDRIVVRQPGSPTDLLELTMVSLDGVVVTPPEAEAE